MIIKSDYRIPSVTDGHAVLLRNKHLNDEDHRIPEHAVLFVHGATYGATATFDYAIEGESWMDCMAACGFDAWCLDLLGYGESDRPVVMSEPADRHGPIVDTEHAVAEVGRAVDFILKDRQIESVSLIGYSWGSAICGRFAGLFPEKVYALVLSGALWVEQDIASTPDRPEPGSYRTVDVEAVLKRWSTGLSAEAFAQIIPPDRARQWAEAVVGSDPAFETLGVLRAPTGVIKDYLHCAATGEPWYDPGLITCPVQIVVGELDVETTPEQGQKIFALLQATPEKRITVIGHGTHTMLLENQRRALFDVVGSFLLSVC
ncbi:MAG: alpha/beta fold hydrolase [Proteobacteria bacterium]|nr:alpha/beta fold hydrolase [Pseudomonadota bacterium]